MCVQPCADASAISQGAPPILKDVSYWGVVLLLALFGVIASATIGLPFLLLAVALIVLAPWRHRRRVFWPGLAAVGGFIAAFVVVTPLSCTTTAEFQRANEEQPRSTGFTDCTNLIGIDYSGAAGYQPSRLPAFGVALAAAATATTVTRRWVLKMEQEGSKSGL